jgi:hypothetical protein
LRLAGDPAPTSKPLFNRNSTMDFNTPKEALLIAENKRLKAENAYLKEAFQHYANTFTPIMAIDQTEIYTPEMPPSYILPAVADIRGSLARGNNYSVIATLKHAQAEDLQISYFAPAPQIKMNAQYAINELFPYLHERFIYALASKLRVD